MEKSILAKVNGIPITELDVRLFLERLDPQMAAQYRNAEGQKHILNEIINQKLFLCDAREQNLEATQAYKEELAKASEFILIQMNMNGLLKNQEVTETEVRAHFDQNPGNFDIPAKADTSHILVDEEALCLDLREKILKEEISFEEAAQKHSKCPSKAQGGRLGEYEKGKMVPEYDNASFSLQVNELSQPVKTQFGYHLIKLNSRQDSIIADYEAVKDTVRNTLLNQKQRSVYSQKVNEMRTKFPVEILA